MPNNTIQILFIDFNGVISYDNYWQELSDPNHPLHDFQTKIENFLFQQQPQIIKDWMLGKYTSEQIHKILEEKVGVPALKLFPIFEKGCRNMDISKEVLVKVAELKQNYYCILSTGNMDCFDRFTLPNNPILTETFDQIDNSYNLGIFKTSNNGEYFRNTMAKLKAKPENCVVIDDSAKVCRVFEDLGGRAVCAYGIEKVLEGLTNLQK